MQKLLNVEYDHKPEAIEVYPSGVDVIIRCEQKVRTDEMSGQQNERIVWECDVERYDSDEYIKLQMAQYDAVQSQLTEAQVGLVEVYEMLLSTP